jgi:hypothetical protein
MQGEHGRRGGTSKLSRQTTTATWFLITHTATSGKAPGFRRACSVLAGQRKGSVGRWVVDSLELGTPFLFLPLFIL